MINLIDHKKSEGALEAHIRSIHTTAGLKGVEYVAFDFHQECGGGTSLKWDDSISPLVNDLGPTLSRHGCFVAQGSGVEEKCGKTITSADIFYLHSFLEK